MQESFLLASQSAVDNFKTRFGPCNRVVGDLVISGSDISNLDGLSDLISVGGDLQVKRCNRLLTLDGLSGLTAVGGLIAIVLNDSLVSLSGLSNITSLAKNLRIASNPTLPNLNGLQSLISINGLAIESNRSLENIDALASLNAVGNEVFIGGNSSLKNIDGLSALTVVGGYLGLVANDSILDVEGLSNLVHADNLDINSNKSLHDLDGLRSLSELKRMSLFWNDSLSNLDGLAAIRQIEGDLEIFGNPQLEDCTGLARLVDGIDDWQPGPGPEAGGVSDVGGTVNISGNSKGCNSISEILGSVSLTSFNSALNDAWFNPETNGQGFLIAVFPDSKQIFLAWFTYDTERPPEGLKSNLGEPGHRWLTAQGSFFDNAAELTLYVTSGGVFDSGEPDAIIEPYGEILLEFSSCNAGIVTYDIPSILQQGAVSIERITLDNVPLCYLLEKQTRDSNPANLLCALPDRSGSSEYCQELTRGE